ncbi:hypothetical protein [Sphaerotilus mobilis]|uniref:ElaB/YqjD/DUF883 family membrane-anchored ribosome-binding protein n=1 Tax=Sphaerotilus mobilis TaxID=47994 RepID=A0A4Q7L8J6_9BURK|nr:hypothetical protein [Sphaerotilus mobilis]RZS46749.1 hypothetical protein EV685_4006 [Sphaerotilus mobilis]
MSSEHASFSQAAAQVTDALVDGAARIANGGARVRPALHELAGGIEDLAHEGLDAARERARSARLAGASYIREQPLPSLLLAASAGAALVLIGGWLLRPRGGDHRDR